MRCVCSVLVECKQKRTRHVNTTKTLHASHNPILWYCTTDCCTLALNTGNGPLKNGHAVRPEQHYSRDVLLLPIPLLTAGVCPSAELNTLAQTGWNVAKCWVSPIAKRTTILSSG